MTRLPLIGLVVLVLWPALVSAHVLETSSTIGAVLHVDPSDQPIAGVPTRLTLEFTDQTGQFTAEHCRCQFQVGQGSAPVASGELTKTSATIASATVTFPAAGLYELLVAGQPATAANFMPFALHYELRVAAAPNTPTRIDHRPHLVAAGLLVIIFLVLLVQDRQQLRQRASQR